LQSIRITACTMCLPPAIPRVAETERARRPEDLTLAAARHGHVQCPDTCLAGNGAWGHRADAIDRAALRGLSEEFISMVLPA
jgi:hypothetical protein